jgi:peptidoglycan/LPS O-acetylase OafA/YrhL
MASLNYRADIDGLRAVAVTSVVLFHAFPGSILSGGFTGVDVFFVISGYLITRIIAGEMSRNSFSLLGFYERRIKRIIPALVVVLLASLAVGWFVLQPGDYRSMAQSAIYAILSFSNVFFLNHTGYFDAAAHTMPLLHTWSLGVEEQFYIIWPALLAGTFWVSRRIKRSILWLLLPFAGLTLFYSVWLTGSDSKAAFYLSTSRTYELLIGALVAVGIVPQALLRRPLVAHSASLVGAGLIICGFLVLDAGRPFPGLNGLLPTIGAALVISGGLETPGMINRFLALPPFAFLGKISYSLYLWHWPVLVFFAHYAANSPTAQESVALIVLSVILATLSYRLIERPARASTRTLTFHYAGFAASAAAISIPAFAIVMTGGVLTRIPIEGRGLSSPEVMWEWDCPNPRTIEGLSDSPEHKFCTFGAPWATAKHHGFLWGDSHAQHYAPLIDIVARDFDISFVLYTGRCYPMGDNEIGFDRGNAKELSRCRDAAFSWLADRPGTWVVLAAIWAGLPAVRYDGEKIESTPEARLDVLERAIENTIRTIDASQHPILLLDQFPQVLEADVLCAQRLLSNLLIRPCHTGTTLDATAERAYHKPSHDALKMIASRNLVGLVDPLDRLCTQDICPTFVNGEFIYRDNNHIRRNLSQETKRKIAESIGLGEALRCMSGDATCGSKLAAATTRREATAQTTPKP